MGTNLVTLRVTDPCGASATASTLVIVQDSTPPVVSAPAVITVPVGDTCSAAVPDLTSQITASDNCSAANQLIIHQDPPAGTVFPQGTRTITVSAQDLAGNIGTAQVTLQIVDLTAPVIHSVPGPITVPADNTCHGVVPNVLGGVVASDNCTPSGQLVKHQIPAAGTVLGKGNYTITVCVKDAAGNKATQTVSLTIGDNTAPVIKSVTANPSVLSPPNHQMVPVTVSVVTSDNCGCTPTSKIISITCNEQTSPNEIVITGNLCAKLAATRNGSGRGRIYTITVQSTDTAGNSSTRTVTVTVPQGNGGN
jgi:hypothetical protein